MRGMYDHETRVTALHRTHTRVLMHTRVCIRTSTNLSGMYTTMRHHKRRFALTFRLCPLQVGTQKQPIGVARCRPCFLDRQVCQTVSALLGHPVTGYRYINTKCNIDGACLAWQVASRRHSTVAQVQPAKPPPPPLRKPMHSYWPRVPCRALRLLVTISFI